MHRRSAGKPMEIIMAIHSIISASACLVAAGVLLVLTANPTFARGGAGGGHVSARVTSVGGVRGPTPVGNNQGPGCKGPLCGVRAPVTSTGALHQQNPTYCD